jgi:hypothetical protein
VADIRNQMLEPQVPHVVRHVFQGLSRHGNHAVLFACNEHGRLLDDRRRTFGKFPGQIMVPVVVERAAHAGAAGLCRVKVQVGLAEPGRQVVR